MTYIVQRFQHYLPLEKDMTIILINLNNLGHNDALCQVKLNLAQEFWEKDRGSLNVINLFSLLYLYLSYEYGMDPHLDKIIFFLPINILWQLSTFEIAQWFWRR